MNSIDTASSKSSSHSVSFDSEEMTEISLTDVEAQQPPAPPVLHNRQVKKCVPSPHLALTMLCLGAISVGAAVLEIAHNFSHRDLKILGLIMVYLPVIVLTIYHLMTKSLVEPARR